jgi:hypothetical protein
MEAEKQEERMTVFREQKEVAKRASTPEQAQSGIPPVTPPGGE